MSMIVGGAALAGFAYFLAVASSKQRKVVVAGWLCPGLGHILIGEKKRGLILGGLVALTFLAGMVISDFRNISPFDRHPIWAAAHFFGGLMSVLATLATKGLHIEVENPYYQVGCLYSGVACILNILVVVDAWDFASETKPEGLTAEEAPRPQGGEA